MLKNAGVSENFCACSKLFSGRAFSADFGDHGHSLAFTPHSSRTIPATIGNYQRFLICHKTLARTSLCEGSLTHYQMTNFRLFQTKNGRKFFKLIENTLGKGEIAHYEQFFSFPTVFSTDLFLRGVKRCHSVAMG